LFPCFCAILCFNYCYMFNICGLRCALVSVSLPKKGRFTGNHPLRYALVIIDYRFFNPNISRASSEVAMGRPSSFARRTTLETSSPLDWANTPFER